MRRTRRLYCIHGFFQIQSDSVHFKKKSDGILIHSMIQWEYSVKFSVINKTRVLIGPLGIYAGKGWKQENFNKLDFYSSDCFAFGGLTLIASGYLSVKNDLTSPSSTNDRKRFSWWWSVGAIFFIFFSFIGIPVKNGFLQAGRLPSKLTWKIRQQMRKEVEH